MLTFVVYKFIEIVWLRKHKVLRTIQARFPVQQYNKCYVEFIQINHQFKAKT